MVNDAAQDLANLSTPRRSFGFRNCGKVLASASSWRSGFCVVTALLALLVSVVVRPSFASAGEPLASATVGELSLRLTREGGGEYTLSLAGSSATPEVIVIENPLRFVVDVPGVASRTSQSFPISDQLIGSLRIGSHPDKTRIVLDLRGSAPPTYSTTPEGNGAKISISFSGAPPSDDSRIDQLLEETGGEVKPRATPKATPAVVPSPAPTPKPRSTSTPAPTPVPILRDGEENGVREPIDRGKGGEEEILPGSSVEDPLEDVIPKTTGPGATIRAIYYQTTNNTKVPALAIDIEGLDVYTLNRKRSDLFELVIENAHLGGSYLSLPQFPPDSFKGFSVVMAKEQEGKVVIQVFVDENTKLFPFTAKGQLWLRVGQ